MRYALPLACLLLTASAYAQEKVLLKETAAIGNQSTFKLDMQLGGKLEIKSGEKVIRYDLKAKASHAFPERVLAVDKDANPTRVVRHYDQATAEISVHGAKTPRSLRPERQIVVAQNDKDGTLTYAPSGPLTRDELELVGEHLDVLAIPALLPGSEVVVGGTWHVTVPTLRSLTDIEGVLSEQIVCRLEKIQAGEAVIHIAGKVEGIHHGSEVKCTVDSHLHFDIKAGRWTKLIWRQQDERGAGPVSPASKTEMTTTVTKQVGGASEHLTDALATALAAEPNAAQLLLLQRDAKGRYEFHYDRNWHVVSQNDRFVVMRLLERGELLGQLNVAPHLQARRGEHIGIDEFQQRVQNTPDFKIDQVLQAGEVPADPGHWVYRISATGTAGELRVIQNHYAIAGPRGDQVLLTFTTEPALAERFGARDLSIVGTVVFPGK